MGPYRSYDKIIYLSIYLFSGRVAYQSLVCRLEKIIKSNYINEKMSVNIKCKQRQQNYFYHSNGCDLIFTISSHCFVCLREI